MPLYSTQIQTPVGSMTAWASDQGICLFDFEHRRLMQRIQDRIRLHLKAEAEPGDHPYFTRLREQLQEYFLGKRMTFDLPLQLLGSPFQIRVWEGLQEIPYGRIRTYKEQSRILGNELAIRAVASANGANGLAILIPCHRVVGAQGSLTGYGGGLARKKWLLDHEQRHAAAAWQPVLF